MVAGYNVRALGTEIRVPFEELADLNIVGLNDICTFCKAAVSVQNKE
jgi:hypothetical protein